MRAHTKPPKTRSTDARRQGPALLVCPGWKDENRRQYEQLRNSLSGHGWTCACARLPDASWPAAELAAIDREDSLRRVTEDQRRLAAHAEVDVRSFALLGFSYGGYMAALLANPCKAAWLVLRSPALYPDEDWFTPKEGLDDRKLAS